ncbi:MAG: nuclear transport factor 2 family protein [Thermoleophilaceae bacterium]
MDDDAADNALASLRRGYDAFNRGDFDAVMENLDPAIEVQERADAPDPRHASGREQVIAAFRSLHEEFEDYRFEEREFRVEGDHVIAVMRQSGRGRISGVPVEGDIVHAWRTDGRRLTGLQAFSTLDEALAALADER